MRAGQRHHQSQRARRGGGQTKTHLSLAPPAAQVRVPHCETLLRHTRQYLARPSSTCSPAAARSSPSPPSQEAASPPPLPPPPRVPQTVSSIRPVDSAAPHASVCVERRAVQDSWSDGDAKGTASPRDAAVAAAAAALKPLGKRQRPLHHDAPPVPRVRAPLAPGLSCWSLSLQKPSAASGRLRFAPPRAGRRRDPGAAGGAQPQRQVEDGLGGG